MLVSLASEKTAAQARAAELETKFTRAAEERRKRMDMSRYTSEIAAQRLSAAESRAATAEARVEAVARRLIASERRLREAERAAAATAAGSAAATRGNGTDGELSSVDENAGMKGGALLEGIRTENTFFTASTGEEMKDLVFSSNAVQAIAEATATAQRLSEQKVAAEQRADELEKALSETRRKIGIGIDLPGASAPSTFTEMPTAAWVADGENIVSSLAQEKQAAVERIIEVEKQLAEAHSRIHFLENLQDNTYIASQTCENEGGGVGIFNDAKKRLDEAEEQAKGLRVELQSAKLQVSFSS